MYLLETKGFNLKKKRGISLRDINIHVENHSIYGLIELDNELKHDLIRALIKPSDLYEGQVKFFGKDQKDSRDFLKRIGIMRNPPIFYEHLNVTENLKLHCEYSGYYDMKAIGEAIHLLNLEDFKDVKLKDMSLRFKKKVALARAIISKPELLILDEPIDGIDTESIKDIVKILRELNRLYKTTIFLTSHNLKEIEDCADKLGILYNGNLIEEKSIAEIQNSYEHFFEIRTGQLREAAYIVSELGMNFKIYEPKTIRIFNVTDSNAIVMNLIKNNIHLVGFHDGKMTLEDYYLEKLGDLYESI